MDLSKLPKAKALSAKKHEGLTRILQDPEFMDKMRRWSAESVFYNQAARNTQDRREPSLETVGNSSEQYVLNGRNVAREGEMKDWIEAKLGSDLTYQAIDQEYEGFLQGLRARLRIGSISRFTVKKEITKSTLTTEQKSTLTTELVDIQERNKALRRTLTRQYTKEFRQYKVKSAKESTNDEVIPELSKKRAWDQEDNHSQDQQTELTTKNRSKDQQREGEEKSEVSWKPTAWKDLPAKIEITSKEPQLEEEAGALEHRNKRMREFVEKGQGTTVPGTEDYNDF